MSSFQQTTIKVDASAEYSDILLDFISKYGDRYNFQEESFEGQDEWFLSCHDDRVGFLKGKQSIISIDWTSPSLLKRFAQTSYKEPLIQAMVSKNKKFHTLMDMTAGLGTDSFIASKFFENVILIERQPLVHLLLCDALRRALVHDKAKKFAQKVTLICADAKDIISACANAPKEIGFPSPDVMYFDFMFENKKTQSSKQMELLRMLEALEVFEGDDVGKVLQSATAIESLSRIVLKAKELSESVSITPHQIHKGKVVNYYHFLINGGPITSRC